MKSHATPQANTFRKTPPIYSVFDFEFVLGVVYSEIFHANKFLGTLTCSFHGPMGSDPV